ncbi:MAG TPA: hypothetical protein VGG97_00670 [Bryobacteraceae bacterium]|jgi:hypothetical protein
MYVSQRWIPALLAVAMAAGTAFGQDAGPVKSYKLEFVVKEVEGAKTLNSRAYSMVALGDKSDSSIRTSSRIMVTKQSPNSSQMVNVDLGVRIDTRVITEADNRLSLFVKVDVTSSSGDPSAPNLPVTRQNQWGSTLAVPLKKPTLIFSSDFLDAKQQMQIEVTAIPFP